MWGRSVFLWVSRAPIARVWAASARQFWWFPSIYAYTPWHRTTKFDVATHVGGDLFLGVSHTPPQRGAVPALPNFCGSFLHWLSLASTARKAGSARRSSSRDRFSPAAHCSTACCPIDETMTLPAVCKTLNRFIHFEHEQIDSANHFYRTVSIQPTVIR